MGASLLGNTRKLPSGTCQSTVVKCFESCSTAAPDCRLYVCTASVSVPSFPGFEPINAHLLTGRYSILSGERGVGGGENEAHEVLSG
jgi:hypothetical protein